MPVSQPLQREYEYKANSLFLPEPCLLGKKIPPLPHAVCGRWHWSKKKKKKEHFYISNLLLLKSSTVCGLCPLWGWQTKDCTGRDDSSDKRVVRNFLSSETDNYLGYDHIRAMLQPVQMWPWASSASCYIWDTFCIMCWITEYVACDPVMQKQLA